MRTGLRSRSCVKFNRSAPLTRSTHLVISSPSTQVQQFYYAKDAKDANNKQGENKKENIALPKHVKEAVNRIDKALKNSPPKKPPPRPEYKHKIVGPQVWPQPEKEEDVVEKYFPTAERYFSAPLGGRALPRIERWHDYFEARQNRQEFDHRGVPRIKAPAKFIRQWTREEYEASQEAKQKFISENMGKTIPIIPEPVKPTTFIKAKEEDPLVNDKYRSISSARGDMLIPPVRVLAVTLIKSRWHQNPKITRTIKSLGLKKIHQTTHHPNIALVRGKLYKVRHMIKVKPVLDTPEMVLPQNLIPATQSVSASV